MRGKPQHTGVLRTMNELLWCRVDWDATGPKYVHLWELEKEPP
jgi:hypothetical protein